MSMVIAPYWFTAGGVFSPLDLSPALWVDPSDAATVTISGSSGAYIGASGLVLGGGVDYAITPDAAANSVTGDIEIVVRCALANWLTLSGAIFGKWNTTGGKSYILYTNASGALQLFLSSNGTANGSVTSSAAVPFANGEMGWVKATYRTSDRRVQFFTAADQSTEPGSWTQLGTDQTHAQTSIFDGTAALVVGANIDSAGQTYRAGTFARAIVRNGIGGTTAFDADFENATPFVSAFTESALGAPVYVVSSTATSPTANYSYIGPTGYTLSGASSNYAEAPDSASLDITGDIDLIAKVTCPSWASALQYVFSKWASTTGYGLRMTAAGELALLYGVSADLIATSTAATGFSAGSTNWIRATRVSSTGVVTFYTSSDGSSWTQLGSTVAGTSGALGTNTAAIRVGALNSGTLPLAGTVHRVIVKDGINGTTVFDADFATAPDYAASFTESSTNAATVTITATNTPANAAGARVSQIDDKSGNSRHLSQGTLANMPRYWNGINGLNCLVFVGTAVTHLTHDAASDVLDFTSYAAFTVLRHVTASGQDARVIATRRDATGAADYQAPNHIMVAMSSASVARVYIRGVLANAPASGPGLNTLAQITTSSSGTAGAVRLNGVAGTGVSPSGSALVRYVRFGALCGSTGNPPITGSHVDSFAGHLGEVVITAALPSLTDCEDYIKTKWGTP